MLERRLRSLGNSTGQDKVRRQLCIYKKEKDFSGSYDVRC